MSELYPDIYFSPAYGLASQPIDGGESRCFRYQDENGVISHLYVLRKIPEDLTGGEAYYDLSTPYGYGGPIVLSCTGDRQTLIQGFGQAFADQCRQDRVVSEFVRFHPLERNVDDFGDLYQAQFLRHTVATRVDGEDPALEFSKHTRKNIRRIHTEDLRPVVTNSPDNLDTFKEIYYDTMDRDQATDFYYFGDAYFDSLLDQLRGQVSTLAIYKEDLCIACGLYFHYGPYAHAHLSGTRKGYLQYSPAYLLKYYGVYWAKDQGCTWFHYGGGTTNDPEDPLYSFKRKFSKSPPFDFHIGRRIYLPEVYDQLVARAGAEDAAFFPAYRAGRA